MEISLFIQALLKKWWLIVLVVVTSISLAYFLTGNIEVQYKSIGQISTGFTMDNDLSDDGINFRGVNVRFSNLIQKFKSKQVLNLLSNRLVLHDIDEDESFRQSPTLNRLDSVELSNLKKELNENLKNKTENYAYNSESEILSKVKSELKYGTNRLSESIRISRISGTDYIHIVALSENPNLSALMVNALCEEFIKYNAEQGQEQYKQLIGILEDRLVKKRAEVLEIRSQLEAFKRKHNLINVDVESQARLSSINNYELTKIEEERKLNAIKLNLDKVNSRLQALGGANDLESNNSELLKIKRAIANLNSRYISSGMEDRDILDSLNNLRALYNLEKSRQQIGAQGIPTNRVDLLEEKIRLETEHEIVKSNLDIINRNLAAQKAKASSLASSELFYNELRNDLVLLETEEDNITKELNRVKNNSTVSLNTMKQTLVGQPANFPEPSKRIMIIILSGIASFLFIVMFIVGLEFMDLSFKNEERFYQMTKLTPSGVLNEIKLKEGELKFLFQENFKSKKVDAFRQNLRKIRLEIIGLEKKIILFTSTKEKVGKSFVIISLAHSLGLIKKKVLIIDTNFKNNTLTKNLIKLKNSDQNRKEPLKLLSFDNYNGQGQDYSRLIHKTQFFGVDIIGSNQIENSPTEIFSDKDFNSFLNFYKNSYDFIFLEGSSLNHFSDSKELVPYCDVVVPVFSADMKLSSEDRVSIKYLENLNGKLINPILNNVKS